MRLCGQRALLCRALQTHARRSRSPRGCMDTCVLFALTVCVAVHVSSSCVDVAHHRAAFWCRINVMEWGGYSPTSPTNRRTNELHNDATTSTRKRGKKSTFITESKLSDAPTLVSAYEKKPRECQRGVRYMMCVYVWWHAM